jgi:F-type H+-transporting ATPase subunit delta
MQVKKEVRQIAREMLRASFTDGQLDRGRIASVVDSILAKRPRNFLKILEYYKRLLRLEAEKRHARIETATALEPQIASQVSLNLARRYGTDLSTEFAINPALRTIATRIELMKGDPSQTAKGTLLEGLLKNISKSGFFLRMRIAVPHGKCLERSLAAIELPPGGVYKGHLLTGKDIVVGIIDDGCAFAHPDFLEIRNAKKKNRRDRSDRTEERPQGLCAPRPMPRN